MRTYRLWVALLLAVLTAGTRGEAQVVKSPPSLDAQIGQMLMVGFRGTSLDKDSYILKALQEINLGGVVLFDYDVPSQSFPRNIQSFAQTKALIRHLQSSAPTPLLVAIDAEGGRINRLKSRYGFLDIPSAHSLGQASLEECRIHYKKLADQLKRLGINLNLAPVVDLDLYPENPVIGSLERSFSARPEIVIQRAEVFIDSHHSSGIITCLKHFPGHGSARNDSHLGLTDVTATFQDIELQPFQNLIHSQKADVVMTAHVMHRDLDPQYPATLSSAILTDLLRERMGFQGIIISDDMQMGAISQNFGFEEALVLAVKAGCDILALANNSQVYDEHIAIKAHHALKLAVRENRIPISRISDSYNRIMRLKQKYGLIH